MNSHSFVTSIGHSAVMLEQPVAGITHTPSGFNYSHHHFPELLEAVKRGVLTSGGLSLEFSTISPGKVFLSPTSLMFCKLMAMDTEGLISSQPVDTVVLMGGFDKTVPAQHMVAISNDLPANQLASGPIMTPRHDGNRLGACTDCRRFFAQYRAGDLTAKVVKQI